MRITKDLTKMTTTEKTMFQKYWWIPLVAATIIIAVSLMLFGDKNNPEIKSIDISDVQTVIVDGESRKTVPAKEFRQFFYDNLGFEDRTLFDTYDSEYVLVTEKDVLSLESTFFDYLKENQIQYEAGKKDCDDFAKIFSRLFADKWNKGKEYKASPAVGYFAFLRRDDQYHMVVIAFGEKNGVLHPMFFETRPVVKRTDINEDEFLSIIGGEFN